ncbi:GSH2 [Sanghuangporus sanghuang]
MASFVFSDWPPHLTDTQQSHLTQLATTYALAHGLLYLPPSSSSSTPAPTSAIHAPLSLFPSPISRNLFQDALQLQKIYNVLYARIALDEEFLDSVMGEVAQVDEFTGQLWRSWKTLRDEGITEDYHLGIFRSDYLLHAPKGSTVPISLKQVEFNTISSSFGALSDRASSLHNYLLDATDYFGLSPHLIKDNLPSNGATSTVVEGLAAAHKAYGVHDAYILFVVQPGERNVFDQRWLEYELLERHNIHVVRQTFDDLLTNASLSPSRVLTLRNALPSSTSGSSDTIEVSVVYYRAGYTPKDYPTPSHYALRETLSRSRAINCPTLALQLAGGKKVQQVLTKEGVLERFLLQSPKHTGTETAEAVAAAAAAHSSGPEEFTPEDLALIRSTWVDMWCLSDPGPPDGVTQALEHHASIVLKPQREGGGNNVYHSSIPSFLSSLPASALPAWIAMRLIEPPQNLGGYLVRAGSGESNAARKDVVSELGVFGWALFGGPRKEGGVVRQGDGGWLVRTKGRESDEGGVAVGFSVLDSILLVD